MKHFPVLLAEAVHELAIKKNGKYLDCTFGRGGHSREILKQLGDDGTLLAFDRDLDAVQSVVAKELLDDNRFELKHASFTSLQQEVAEKGWLGNVDGVLLDLGISSPQVDNPERGFSFLKNGPLDMRMNMQSGVTAAQWLQEVKEEDLVKVLFEFGEEKFSRRIARAIVNQRKEHPITTTRKLADLIEDAIPFREPHKHPATRTFQAIRIEINRELEQLGQVLTQAVTVLKPGGRLVVISFHSLEDRMVKRFIRNESRGKYNPGKMPLRDSEMDQGRLKKIGKAWKAGKEELDKNPRSRSAVMRVAERI